MAAPAGPPAVRPAGGAGEPPAPHPAGGRIFPAAWAATAAALLLVVVWSRSLQTVYLVLPALPLLIALPLAWRANRIRTPREPLRARMPLAAALGATLLALGFAGVTQHELSLVSSRWNSLLAARDRRLTRELDARMAELVSSGRTAAARAAVRAAAPTPLGLFADLTEIREHTGVDAIAVFDSAGQLQAWAGEHRGQLPDTVRTAGPPIQYVERPLFSYLYFSEPTRVRGERAIAAILLQTGLPGRSPAAGDVADRFLGRSGAQPLFAAGPARDAVWTLALDGHAVVHASFERMTQAQWRDEVATRGRRATLLAVVLGILLLSWSWLRRQDGSGRWSGVSLVLVAAAAAFAPLGDVLGIPRLFSPGFFTLQGLAVVVSLGALLAVALPVGALVASRDAAPPEGRKARWLALATLPVVALGFVGGLQLMLGAASLPLLEGGVGLWEGLQVAAVLLLAIIAALAFPFMTMGQGPRSDPERFAGLRWGLLAAAAVLAAGLGLLVVSRWDGRQLPPIWITALWAFPFGLFALGLAPAGRAPRLARWLAAGWLAATAVLPFVWVVHVDARLRSAESQVASLGNRPDPFLDFLLRRFADEVQRRYERGETDVSLLYRTWLASGFAEEAYPAHIMLWKGMFPEQELALGGAPGGVPDSVPPFLADMVDRVRDSGRLVIGSVQGLPNVNEAMAVPLDQLHVVSVVVPPRRELKRAATLAPFVGGGNEGDTRLSLVPAKAGLPQPTEQLRWTRNDEGWRGEALVHYPDNDYHAHVQVMFPSAWVRLARAALLAALDIAILLLLWAVGRLARGEVLAPAGGWRRALGGFRARVTGALFLFFLLPTAIFGLVAYQALAGEVVRSARVVAENAVGQAANEFPAAQGDLIALSLHTGQDLLFYQGGELFAASNVDAMQLGLYDAWMPPDVYQGLQSGEEVSAAGQQIVAEHPYMVAYQRLPVTATVAVPVPLAGGDTAVRQSELAHVILFAILMGGLLTLGLSLAVGRALSRPIGRLSHAAALVGAGRLRVQLPEHRHDEFGQLFASFNRMARRLRRARGQEIRSARVLAWGEMARQVAHEIKNPLTPIRLAVQHIRRAHADRRPDFPRILEDNVDQVLAEIDRLTEIARAFSRYGAPSGSAGPLEALDVGAVLRDALTLYRASDAQVRYVEEIDAPLPRGLTRAGELKEVLLNLVENARAAIDGQGTIRIRAHSLDGFLEVEVADDGPGIPPELLPQIFEPHFSTRSTGTGLGLAIVRRLVESWGGEVTAESEPGVVTTMRVRIPVARNGGGAT